MLREVPNGSKPNADELHVYRSSGDRITAGKPFFGFAKSLYSTYAVKVNDGFYVEHTYAVQDVKRRKMLKMRVLMNGQIDRDPQKAQLAAQLAMPKADLSSAILALGCECAQLKLGAVCAIDLDRFLATVGEIHEAFLERLFANGLTVAVAAIEALPHVLPDKDVDEFVFATGGTYPLEIQPLDTSRVVRYGFNLIVEPDASPFSAAYLVTEWPLKGKEPSVQASIESCVRSFLNSRYTFEENASHLQRIQGELASDLRARLPALFGLKLKHLSLNSDTAETERYEKVFSFDQTYAVNGTQTPLKLRHSGSIRRLDAGEWVRAGAPPDMVVKVTGWIIQATERALQGLSFADILEMDQRSQLNGRSAMQEISEHIEDAVQKNARSHGHEVKQFLAQIVDLPEKGLLNGTEVSIPPVDYGLRDQSYRPSLGFLLHLRLTNPGKLHGMTGFANLMEDRVRPRIRSIIATSLASVLPNDYLRSTFASSGGTEDLRTKLEHDLADALKEEFGLTLISLVVTNDKSQGDPVSTRFAEICDVTREVADIQGLAATDRLGGLGEVRLRLTYRVLGIWQLSTDIFRNKTRLSVDEQLTGVDDVIRRVFEQLFSQCDHDVFDGKSLSGPFGAELKAKLSGKIGGECGIDVAVTDLYPVQSASLTEEREAIQRRLQEVRESLARARSERLRQFETIKYDDDLARIETSFGRRIQALEEEEQEILRKQRPDAYRRLGHAPSPAAASPASADTEST